MLFNAPKLYASILMTLSVSVVGARQASALPAHPVATLGQSASAGSRPSLLSVDVGNGQTTGAQITSVQTGDGPALVNVAALSAGRGHQGSAASITLLGSQHLAGVDKGDPSNNQGVNVSNGSGSPVLSSGFFNNALNGGVGN